MEDSRYPALRLLNHWDCLRMSSRLAGFSMQIGFTLLQGVGQFKLQVSSSCPCRWPFSHFENSPSDEVDQQQPPEATRRKEKAAEAPKATTSIIELFAASFTNQISLHHYT
ncbi:hypothetical protein PoB_000320000 [Plakobranchus ocellatus]|uniref:Uncharacterized protein n=1 Tax=Plakobranchus ocellatus TaxID=259542 RepID=A0AAV3Y1B2_9GAST|nr:hypothetical protein PoB_000320000 [Plakobranchus ocellatus]